MEKSTSGNGCAIRAHRIMYVMNMYIIDGLLWQFVMISGLQRNGSKAENFMIKPLAKLCFTICLYAALVSGFEYYDTGDSVFVIIIVVGFSGCLGMYLCEQIGKS